jgi:hypothetical protein
MKTETIKADPGFQKPATKLVLMMRVTAFHRLSFPDCQPKNSSPFVGNRFATIGLLAYPPELKSENEFGILAKTG